MIDFLGKKSRVTIDSRTFVGTLVAIDYAKNTVLLGATEFRNSLQTFVGLIMIPGKLILKFEVVA